MNFAPVNVTNAIGALSCRPNKYIILILIRIIMIIAPKPSPVDVVITIVVIIVSVIRIFKK